MELPPPIAANRVAKTIIRRALNEDLGGRGDITTYATIQNGALGMAVIVARQSGTIAGQSVAAAVFSTLEKSCRYRCEAPDGKLVDKGEIVARVEGKAWAILAGERTALNILGRCSGIATLTRRFVQAIEGSGCKLSETRKTAPGLRYLDKAAVRVGGGVNHRYALHDAFLIKDNHVAAAGGIAASIRACRTYRERHGSFPIFVEVRNAEEFLEALTEHPDRIMLDNMRPEQLRECAAIGHEGVDLEASGGITLENAREFADAGVDFISVGMLTNAAAALDLSLLME